MKEMEIEKKFLVKRIPEHMEQYEALQIEQGYLSENPVIRIRRMDDVYVLTYKSRMKEDAQNDVCVNREVELPLTRQAYEHLKKKTDGVLVEKTRYRIAYQQHVIELDVFHGKYEGMIMAEVEFASEEEAECFVEPDWFGENVSGDYHYSNAFLAAGAVS